MAEKEIKVIVEGGKATAGPPLGPALGPLGIPAGKVVAEINKLTASFKGLKVPVTVKVDTKTKRFTIEVGTPPTSELLKKEAGIEKGHGAAWKEGSVGDVSFQKIIELAKSTSGKSNASCLKARVKEILGTAQSMGLTIDGKVPKEIIKEINEGKYDSYFQ